MSPVKVDYIVSFSSEDPSHVANNILNVFSDKKWKCQKPGEPSASIILQLEKATKITGVDIGNEHSAFVEVLVNRSSNKSDDYKTLVLMSSFMTPQESQQSKNTNQVRMFRYDQLQSPERDEKWDRVKIVCTQPFNRRVQYGLSFIVLHSIEGVTTAPVTTVTESIPTTSKPIDLGHFTLRPNSPQNLPTGSLFSRRKELLSDIQPQKAAVAIREASSSPKLHEESLKCKPKLKHTTTTTITTTPNLKRTNARRSEEGTKKLRNRNELLYDKDEEQPHTKIDKLVEAKNKEKQEKAKESEVVNGNKKQPSDSHKEMQKLDNNKKDASIAETSKRKLNQTSSPNKKAKPNTPVKLSKPFNKLLEGVIISISGIQNPERSTIRNEALALGAKYKSDWDNSCTHLICAFTNTPKFNQVKGKGKIVNRLWISDCHAQRKKIPWRRYALDVKDQNAPESEDEICEETKSSVVKIDDDDDTDAEDEIDRIQALQKAQNKINQSCYAADTDEEIIEPKPKNDLPKLPDYLSNKILYVDKELNELRKLRLIQYITAANGLLVDDPSDIVDYAISSSGSVDVLKGLCPDAKIVKPDWVWECYNAKKLLSFKNFLC